MEHSLFTPLSSKIGHKLICNKNEKPPKSKTKVLDLENTLVYSSSTLIPHYDYTISRELQTIVPEKKIIVLELTDTLVKRSKEVLQCGHDFTVPVRINGELCMTYIQKRPGLDNLLAELEQNYEIVLYTRYTREQADPVLDKLDIGFYLNWRLYRDNCQGSGLCKDIGVLNKDLNLDANVKNVVFVDCDASAFQHHPYNGFLLNPFQDDNPLDIELCRLKGFCKWAYLYDDVREAIANFNRNGARRRVSYFR
ncbi:hypothetical protein SUGI_0420700 [Cryptomeria japonica]|nr:hypothetical protein SUGI_0420700 [Cryptomeria japonica]